MLPKVAIVLDIREGGFLRSFARVWRKLKAMPGLDPRLIFLEASHDALVRRFSETRRPHPLALDRPVVEGIRSERRQMAKIRALADQIVDTTHLTVHQLREQFQAFARTQRSGAAASRHASQLRLQVRAARGRRHRVRRALPAQPALRAGAEAQDGRDRAVVTFLRQQPLTGEFLEKTTDLLTFLIPEYVREGKAYLTIAIGCTGGRHRSVMIAEALKPALEPLQGVRVRVRHRDVDQPV